MTTTLISLLDKYAIEHKLTTAKLCKRLGIGLGTFYNIKNGKRPTNAIYAKIGDTIGVPGVDLYDLPLN